VTSTLDTRHPVPILLYHSVEDDPPTWIAPYTVSPATFRAHLDAVVASGRTPLTVSQYVDGMAGKSPLPERAVLVTFDDGFADTLTAAAPALAERRLPATVYVTTGALRERGGVHHITRLGSANMLARRDLGELEACGLEIGSHSHTHPPLDVVPSLQAVIEIADSKAILEDALGHDVRSFAYPHGYHDRRVKGMVTGAGYDSGAAVRNALSSPGDDSLALARLMVMADTSLTTIESWLCGAGARIAPFRERLATKVWRVRRRFGEETRPVEAKV
jgi:peptidoglycan/xylan/chitin deacetylase (PgdA/CDA1 family)